ncbi:MAG: hypothetical protein WD492_12815 [Alkalispirochaeta sp.]
MIDLKSMKTAELVRLRRQIETDPRYRAPLAGHTPEARRRMERIKEEIQRRIGQ